MRVKCVHFLQFHQIHEIVENKINIRSVLMCKLL